MAAVLASTSASAQARDSDLRRPRAEPAPKAIPSGLKASNPCAQYGAGFVRADGSQTCVKIGGQLSVGMGGRR